MKVLHVPFHFEPARLGGTEIYVAALVLEMAKRGTEGCIVAPGDADDGGEWRGVRYRRFTPGRVTDSLGDAYGVPSTRAVEPFDAVLRSERPDVVHFHARTAAASRALVEQARRRGAAVVFTYHTPTASCARGTMLYRGESPCDGRLDGSRCVSCALVRGRVGPVRAAALRHVSAVAAPFARRHDGASRIERAVRIPALIEDFVASSGPFLQSFDRVVAVCDWVARVLERAGVPERRLVVSRQGLPFHVRTEEAPVRGRDGNRLRLCYFGRLDRTKGVDLIVAAMRRAMSADAELDIYGVAQNGADAYLAAVEAARQGDPRIRLLPSVSPAEVVATMRRYDLVVVPSQWMETGPLVVLEAFAAGRPVLGSDLGGIAELVRHDVNGRLVAPADVGAWAGEIRRLAAAPAEVARLATGVRPPRTMADAAADMEAVYRAVVEGAGAVVA